MIVYMWTKDQSAPARPVPPSSPAPPPVRADSSGPADLVGETVRIIGDVQSSAELHMNGEIEGSLRSQGRIVIGPKGKVHAHITAREVVISGSVQGNVEAEARIVLRTGANLVGDVKTTGIVIEDGAYFKGGIDIARPAADAAGTK